MQDIILQLEGIEKKFDDTEVLKGIDLTIWQGEFITLLGASGCGKTTTLRIIAGLEEPDQGRVLLENVDVTDIQPNHRNVNTVFQSYALFPHMTVAANIAYSQKIKKVAKTEIKKRVDDVLELVQLEGFGDRMPNQLSGGQRQRVAIARAVINRPKLLLLDEPLGALDLQLRHQMQIELKRIQKRLGITFVYITHDQEEALNMSDRIVVMRDGRFEQIGSPAEIYDNPQTSYVASFVGSANIITGTVVAANEKTVTVENENGYGLVAQRGASPRIGDTVTYAIRGEYISLCGGPEADSGCLSAVVKEKNFSGGSMRILLELADKTEITSNQHGIDCPVQVGDVVCATWPPDRAVLVDLEAD